MHLILLGAPGAGKGTQAVSLSKELGLAHIASGDLFRRAQERDTALGREVKGYMGRGELVPDELTVRMVLERLEAPDCERGAILDGFPRTLAQARALDDALAGRNRAIDAVLYIKVSDEELVRRLSGRWICRSCQTPYHSVNSPPQTAGKCDHCGGELHQRADDAEETVRNRLKVFMEQTAPLIEYYVNLNKLLEVDGEQDIDVVSSSMSAALKAQAVGR